MLLTVIGVTVAITLSVGGVSAGDDPTAGPPTSGGQSGSAVASIDDDGPAAIIIADPTCDPASPIFEARASSQRNGWETRDPANPASTWTPAVRAQYEAVGQSMRSSAAQLLPLVKLTPHRVMRELYEQVIAYSLAYADRIASYTAPDDNLALASIAAADAISRMCAAVSNGSAASRAPLTPPPSSPSQIPSLGDPDDPQRFLAEPNPVCADWAAALSRFSSETAAWAATSPETPASQWTPEQRSINDAVAPVMNAFADTLETLSERSGNATLNDFATLSAQYRRAYVQSLASYTPPDQYLASASLKLAGVIGAACLVAQQ